MIDDAGLFRIRMTLAGKSDEIVAGNYTLAKDMSYGSAIDALSKEPGTGQIVVTVPEGYTLDQIADARRGRGPRRRLREGRVEAAEGLRPRQVRRRRRRHARGLPVPGDL